MSRIRLTWTNASTTIVEQRVYRSTSPLDFDNMPVPLAVLPRRDREYLDSTIEDGLTYYYAVSSVLPDYSELISEEIKVEATPGESDPHFDKVSLLLHMDGVDGSITFTDSSAVPNDVTAYGGATVSAAQSKFGESLFLNGSGAYLSIPYKTSAFRWWDSQFTLEVFVFPVALSTFSYVEATAIIPKLIGNSSIVNSTNYWSFGPVSDGRVLLRYWNGVTNAVYSAATIPESQWSHIALVVNDGKITIYVNGVGSAPVAIAGTPQDAQTLPLLVGATNSRYVNGYIDEMRITKGVARYTENFTPPTKPFPNK